MVAFVVMQHDIVRLHVQLQKVLLDQLTQCICDLIHEVAKHYWAKPFFVRRYEFTEVAAVAELGY